MRVLIAHNEYLHKGGEDTVVKNEIELLRHNGHEVSLHLVSNTSLSSLKEKLSAAWNISDSITSYRLFNERLHAVRPDIVHVHNFFPLLTPSIYRACRDFKVPVVQTLHNFRIGCANGLLLREGKPCEDCLGNSPLSGVVHGCYRGSRLATIPVAFMIQQHQKAGTWRKDVDRFIVTSSFSQKKLEKAGIPPAKTSIKPNFVFAPKTGHLLPSRPYPQATALFVGRLSEEKGIRTLIHAWRGLNIPLRIAGDGPLRTEIEKASNPAITLLGQLTRTEDVWKEMSTCDFLVIPSECYENFPLALAEGFANGLPVIASKLGSMGELIEDGQTGLLFENGKPDDLREKVIRLAENRALSLQMGKCARQVYERHLTPERNYEMLFDIYQKALRS